jgi:hypothetical protein
MVEARLQTDLAYYAARVELIVLPAANPGHVQPTDFDHPEQLIAAALKAARALLHLTPVPDAIAA